MRSRSAPAGRSYTTAELSINIVRPASHKTGPLRAVATFVHVGRQMATAEARVEDERGSYLNLQRLVRRFPMLSCPDTRVYVQLACCVHLSH